MIDYIAHNAKLTEMIAADHELIMELKKEIQTLKAQLKRKPLSADKIEQLAWECNLLDDYPHDFVKAVEKAHGIGVK